MASEVFFNRVPYTQRRISPHQHYDLFASDQASSSSSTLPHFQRSVGTTRSGGALTFPPLYLDPVDSHGAPDQANNPHSSNPSAPQPGSFALGSTFYHHPELNALVSNHLIDASANAADGAAGTGNAFLANVFANRDGGDDDSDGEDAGGIGAGGSGAAPRPRITSEFVSLNEDLIPASLDMHGDMLPADQHPSYPFGNLFGPLGGMIAADSAIVGGGGHGAGASALGSASLGSGLGDAAATLGLDFGGGLDGFISLGQSNQGRRGPVSNSWNNFINKASRSKLVGSAGAQIEWDGDSDQKAYHSHDVRSILARGKGAEPTQADIIRSAKKLDLSPSLLFRTSTSTVLAAPTWPFRRHGPGCTSYAALLRPSSNIFGNSPASAAVAATLGGLPASAKIINEVWSDLALEELVPTQIGETSAVRHLSSEQDEADAEADSTSADAKGAKKRKRTDAETDSVFAKRIAAMEADPLDLLGPVSREIRGQAAMAWGTAFGSTTRTRPDGSRPRRHRSTYSNQSEDETAEAEHDDPDAGYSHRDRLRYSFALPPATFSWTESPDDEEELGSQDEDRSGVLHVEPDGIGWSTAKRIFINEERDRLLPEIASRATGAGGGIEAYQVRGIRANQGLMPRPAWTWADGPVGEEEAGERSFATEMSGSTSFQADLHATMNGVSEERGDEQLSGEGSEGAYYDEDAEDEEVWQEGAGGQEDEDAELQRALLMQYQGGVDGEADRVSNGHLEEDEDVEEVSAGEEQDEQHEEYDDEAEEEEAVEEDEEVESYDGDEPP